MVLFLVIIVLLSVHSSLSVCPDLPFVTNGSISYSESPAVGGSGYSTGTLAIHICNEGYLLSYETSLRVCQNDSSWSGQSIWCVSAGNIKLNLANNDLRTVESIILCEGLN